jgi:hypothetical protein
MSTFEIVWRYVHACARGALPAGECAPIWQLAAIAVLVLAALVALVALRRGR